MVGTQIRAKFDRRRLALLLPAVLLPPPVNSSDPAAGNVLAVLAQVLRVLPDYCEAARAERSSSQEKSDCARRADRIRERVRGRL